MKTPNFMMKDCGAWLQQGGAGVHGTRLVGRILEDQMRRTDEYWAACEKFKRIKPIPGIDAAHRLTREEAHERRR